MEMEIDVAEMAVRIMEALLKATRPEGRGAREILNNLPEDMRDSFADAAVAAVEYLREAIAAGGGTSYIAGQTH